MVGPISEKEIVVLLEAVVETVRVSADVGIIVEVTDSPSVTKTLVDSVIASEALVEATVLSER